jgi:hypothetical protein
MYEVRQGNFFFGIFTNVDQPVPLSQNLCIHSQLGSFYCLVICHFHKNSFINQNQKSSSILIVLPLRNISSLVLREQ